MIEPAYEELARLIAGALCAAQFIDKASDLKIDPEAPFTPSGDERDLVRAAALMKARTGSVRQLLGGQAPRHVVERQCQLEMAIAGPSRVLKAARVSEALVLLAGLPNAHPTLGGRAERLILGEQTDDDLPPNGVTFTLTFTIRVRSGDPLGRTP